MTEEMQKMVEVFKENDVALRNNQDLFNHYIAPDIPEKIMKKLIKYYDSHLPTNNVVAFYDSTLFGSCKTGLVFTNEGIYYHYIGKPIYIRYADITGMRCFSGSLEVSLNSEDMPECTIFEVCNMNVLRDILQELIDINEEYGQSSFKTSGTVKKMDLPPDKMKKCNGIIHTASVACGGVGTGLAQIPASDNAVIVPIQVTMIVSLGAVFDLNITEGMAKGIIASAGATIAGRTLSQFLVGWMPVIGNAINTATAAGVTEAIGWIAVKNFYDRWIEDRNKGRDEGRKDGYVEASREYERKLRKQADEFLNQIKDIERERDEYEKLLDDYEKYIEELEKKYTSSDQINEMKEIYDGLKNLRSA